MANVQCAVAEMFEKVLHYSYRDYGEIPEKMLRSLASVVEEIYLKENNIRKIPSWFLEEMSQLRLLNLAGNILDTLPPRIDQLVNLQTLDLSNNAIRQLPPTIGRLRLLSRLSLNGNFLSQLPPELGDLLNLEELEVSNNLLITLPATLSKCRALANLYLYDNSSLVSIPRPIFALPALAYVSVEGCNLYQLPFFITSGLKMFFDRNVRLTHIPLAVEHYSNPSYIAPAEEEFHCIRNPSGYRHVRCPNVPYILNFPPELAILNSRQQRNSEGPSTLLENALLACDKHGLNAEHCVNSLPGVLPDRLRNGPVALCTNSSCGIERRKIFHEAVLMLLKRKERWRSVPLSALFCSSRCANQWFGENGTAFEELPWELLDGAAYRRD